MYKIIVFIPLEDKEKVKESMFTAGAGSYDSYDKCCYETQGIGQFRPLKGSSPTIGKIDDITLVNEMKIEMICDKKNIKEVIKEMKRNHPYEVPAYDIIELVDL